MAADSLESASKLSMLPARWDLARCAMFLVLLSFGGTALNMGSVSFNGLTVLWPTNAFLVGVLLCRPKRQAWAFLLLGFAVDLALNSYLRLPWLSAVLLGGCNTCEILLAAVPLYSIIAPNPDLTQRRQLIGFTCYAILLAPGVSAFLAATVVSRPFALPSFHQYYHWFTGDALGMATITPLYLALRRERPFGDRSWLQSVGLLSLLAAGIFAVFWQTQYHLLFFVLFLLLLAGVRLHLAGASSGLLLVSVIGGFLSARGHGPFGVADSQSAMQRDFNFQLFIATSMAMLYVVEVVMAERQRVRMHLEGSERRFRLLAEASSDIIVMATLDKSFTYISPAVERILGWRAEELLGYKFRELGHPDDRSRVSEGINELLNGVSVRPIEYRCRKVDGSYTWLELHARLYHDTSGGSESGFVNVLRDISFRKVQESERERAFEIMGQTNEALKEARTAALQATEAKSRFLSHMSHEIRTPMNGVLGMIQLLASTSLSEEQSRYVHVAESSGRAMLGVLDDCLDLSKIEAGRLEIEDLIFDLRRVLTDFNEAWLIRAKSKGLTFGLHIDPQTPSLVHGDPNRLRQVLNNLVSNAVKFTEWGGVTLQVRAADKIDGKTSLHFAVTDTGIGIRSDQVPALFAPFVQANSSTTRNFGGTGLGLSICKNLVELMGGKIGIESQEGQGSTFWFTLAFETAPANDATATSGLVHDDRPVVLTGQDKDGVPTETPRSIQVRVTHSGKVARILVAEDNPTNREVALAQLSKLGYKAEAVVNGAEAVEAFQRGDFDVILMDCEMPVMDGHEATRRIRKIDNSKIPIIAVTAHSMVGERDVCIQDGMDDYLSKPVDMVELAEVLARWCPGGDLDQSGATVLDLLPIDSFLPVFDSEGMLKRLMGDQNLADVIIGGFLGDFPSQLANLRGCLLRFDAGDAFLHAHTLKGSSAAVSASRLSAVGAEMEREAGRLDRFETLVPKAVEEFEAFRRTMAKTHWL